MKKESNLQKSQRKVEEIIKRTNEIIDELGMKTNSLYKSLNNIQEQFDVIRNIPTENKLEYEGLRKVRLDWEQQVEQIEKEYQNAAVKNGGIGAAGTAAGVAVVALGPTAAMGIATTFGVASTGTAISALSGAAATNAALAWLGGGALAAGGGGMVAGNALLALAGPVGWAIAGVSLLTSGFLVINLNKDKAILEMVFNLISERDLKSYKLAIVELEERINRIINENKMLIEAIEKIKTFGLDYSSMSEHQQYELGSYVNLMNSSTQLLVNPILGLLPKYSEKDFYDYVSSLIYENNNKENEEIKNLVDNETLIVSLANLLYKIDIDDKETKLLYKYLRSNKSFLESMKITKKDFKISIFQDVQSVLAYKYNKIEV